MSMMVSSYMLGAGPPVATAISVLANKGSSSSNLAVGAVVPYSTETFDRSGWHDNVTNNSRLTVPSTGLYRFAQSYNGVTASCYQQLNVNGAAAGVGRSVTYTGGDGFSCSQSGILSLAAGDYAEIVNAGNIETYSATDYCWFAAEKIDATTKYALVSKSANQALSANVSTTLTWNQETADTNSFHDNVTNNSRLTVPSGVTCVKLSYGLISSAAFAGQMFATMLKNGATFVGAGQKDHGNDTSQKAFTGVSAPIVVSAGDYFELQANVESAVSILADNRSWFQIEEVPASVGRCLVQNSTGVSAGTTAAAMPWDTEVYDTAAIHSTVSNSSRMTVPSGYTQARLSFCLSGGSAAGRLEGFLQKNGASFPGNIDCRSDTTGGDSINGTTAWLDVTPGDYFELLCANSAGTRTLDPAVCWFCMEVR